MNQNSKIVFQNLRVSSHFLISFISSPLQQLPREVTQPVSMFFGSSKSPWPSRQRPSLRYFPWAPSPAPLEQLVTIWKEYDSMITWYNDFMGFKRKTTLFEKLRENKVGIHIYVHNSYMYIWSHVCIIFRFQVHKDWNCSFLHSLVIIAPYITQIWPRNMT